MSRRFGTGFRKRLPEKTRVSGSLRTLDEHLAVAASKFEVEDKADVAEKHNARQHGDFSERALVVNGADVLYFSLFEHWKSRDFGFVQRAKAQAVLGLRNIRDFLVESRVLSNEALVQGKILNRAKQWIAQHAHRNHADAGNRAKS